MITIHKYLLGNRENETEKTRVQEIDAELCELGLQPSRRNTNTLQGVFEKMYRMNPINFDRLDIKMRDLGIREI